MKFDELINGIEKSRMTTLSEHELMVIKKLWNACVDCIADEWPVLGDPIRQLKQPYNNHIERTQ